MYGFDPKSGREIMFEVYLFPRRMVKLVLAIGPPNIQLDVLKYFLHTANTQILTITNLVANFVLCMFVSHWLSNLFAVRLQPLCLPWQRAFVAWVCRLKGQAPESLVADRMVSWRLLCSDVSL